MNLRIFILSVLGCLQVGLQLSYVVISKHLVDVAVSGPKDKLWTWIWILGGCLLAQFIISPTVKRLRATTYVKSLGKLRSRLFKQALMSPLREEDSMHSTELAGRLQQDAATVTDFGVNTVPALVIILAQFLGATAYLASLNLQLAIVLVFIMPMALAIGKIYFSRTKQLATQMREADSGIMTYAQECLRLRIIFRAFGREDKASGDFADRQGEWSGISLRRNALSIYSSTFTQIGFSLGYAVALAWGAYGLSNGTVAFGTFAAFLQLVSLVQRPVIDAAGLIPRFLDARVAKERIDSLPPLQEPATMQPDSRDHISLTDVTFSYPGREHLVIDDFSCEFPIGQSTAIVGPTGIGKSTIGLLLLGAVTPQKGTVVCRGPVGYAPQDGLLISGTIRENLCLARPEATDSQIADALHAACADFVYDLPNGLDTIMAEDSEGLSRGQAQRIAIARALLMDAPVVLLDEPTASLDSQTEQEIMSRLTRFCASKTLIIITHKTATAAFCQNMLTIPHPGSNLDSN